MRTARAAATVCAPAGGWAALAHALAGIGLWPALAFAAMTSAAAFGVGYEIADGGTAAALFLLLAGVGLVVAPAALLFATLPALIGAASAHVGGSLRERRTHGLIRAKEVVET